MSPIERNANELKLVKLKYEFIKIGIFKMPTNTILELMPDNLKGVDAVKWSNVASNVWNGRSTQYKAYLPVFENALEILKDTEIVN